MLEETVEKSESGHCFTAAMVFSDKDRQRDADRCVILDLKENIMTTRTPFAHMFLSNPFAVCLNRHPLPDKAGRCM